MRNLVFLCHVSNSISSNIGFVCCSYLLVEINRSSLTLIKQINQAKPLIPYILSTPLPCIKELLCGVVQLFSNQTKSLTNLRNDVWFNLRTNSSKFLINWVEEHVILFFYQNRFKVLTIL